MISKETLQGLSKKATSVIFFFMCAGVMGIFSWILLPTAVPSLKDVPFIQHWVISTIVLSFSFVPHLIGGRARCPLCVISDKIEQKFGRGGAE